MDKYYVYFSDGNFEVIEGSSLEIDFGSVQVYNSEGKTHAIFPLGSIRGIFPYKEDSSE